MSKKDPCYNFTLELLKVIFGASKSIKLDISSYYTSNNKKCECIPEIMSTFIENLDLNRYSYSITLNSTVLKSKVDNVEVDITEKIKDKTIKTIEDLFKIKIAFCRDLEELNEGGYLKFVYYPVIKIGNELRKLNIRIDFNCSECKSCEDKDLEKYDALFKDPVIFLVLSKNE